MLLGDTVRPYTEPTAAATQAISTARAYKDFSKKMHMASWPESNEQALSHLILEWHMWVVSDDLQEFRTDHFDRAGVSRPETFVLLKRHPTLC
jgi:hypothetical protein